MASRSPPVSTGLPTGTAGTVEPPELLARRRCQGDDCSARRHHVDLVADERRMDPERGRDAGRPAQLAGRRDRSPRRSSCRSGRPTSSGPGRRPRPVTPGSRGPARRTASVAARSRRRGRRPGCPCRDIHDRDVDRAAVDGRCERAGPRRWPRSSGCVWSARSIGVEPVAAVADDVGDAAGDRGPTGAVPSTSTCHASSPVGDGQSGEAAGVRSHVGGVADDRRHRSLRDPRPRASARRGWRGRRRGGRRPRSST